MKENRTVFLIDGFNLYHSVREASRDLGGVSTKWLDLRAWCEAHLSSISPDARIKGIYYFSALARHLEAFNPGATARHRALLDCLAATGVTVALSRFKRKDILVCEQCNGRRRRYEEKETDVAIAAKLLEVLVTDACDTVVLVTGDTDLAPAVRTARALWPEKEIMFAFPYKRKNRELEKLVTRSFVFSKESYARHQLADPFRLPDGTEVRKPVEW